MHRALRTDLNCWLLGGVQTPGLRKSVKDWAPVCMLQDTGNKFKSSKNRHSHSEPETFIVNLFLPRNFEVELIDGFLEAMEIFVFLRSVNSYNLFGG